MTSTIEQPIDLSPEESQQAESAASNSEHVIESPGQLIERMAQTHGSGPERVRIPYANIAEVSEAFDALVGEGEQDEHGVFDRYIDPVTRREVDFLTATDLQAELDNDRQYWHLARRLPTSETATGEVTASSEDEADNQVAPAIEPIKEPTETAANPINERKRGKNRQLSEADIERARLRAIHDAAAKANDRSRIKPDKMGWNTYGQKLAYLDARQEATAERGATAPDAVPEAELAVADTEVAEAEAEVALGQDAPVIRPRTTIELADGTIAKPSPVARNPRPATPATEPAPTSSEPRAPRKRRSHPKYRGPNAGMGLPKINELRDFNNKQLELVAAGQDGVVRQTGDDGQPETWRQYETRLPLKVSAAKRIGVLAAAALVGGKAFISDAPGVVALDRARNHYDQHMKQKRLEANAVPAPGASILSQRFAQAKEKFDTISRLAYAKLTNATDSLSDYLDTGPDQKRKTAAVAVGALAIAGLGLAFLQAKYSIEDGGLLAASPKPGAEGFMGPVALPAEAPDTTSLLDGGMDMPQVDGGIDVPQTEAATTERQVVQLETYNQVTADGTVDDEVREQFERLGLDSNEKSVGVIRDATRELNGWSDLKARELAVGQDVTLLSPLEIEELLKANTKL